MRIVFYNLAHFLRLFFQLFSDEDVLLLCIKVPLVDWCIADIEFLVQLFGIFWVLNAHRGDALLQLSDTAPHRSYFPLGVLKKPDLLAFLCVFTMVFAACLAIWCLAHLDDNFCVALLNKIIEWNRLAGWRERDYKKKKICFYVFCFIVKGGAASIWVHVMGPRDRLCWPLHLIVAAPKWTLHITRVSVLPSESPTHKFGYTHENFWAKHIQERSHRPTI